MNAKITPQEKQNRIYRKMSASKKLKIVDDFYKYSIKLQQANGSINDRGNFLKENYDYPKVCKSNRLHLKSA